MPLARRCRAMVPIPIRVGEGVLWKVLDAVGRRGPRSASCGSALAIAQRVRRRRCLGPRAQGEHMRDGWFPNRWGRHHRHGDGSKNGLHQARRYRAADTPVMNAHTPSAACSRWKLMVKAQGRRPCVGCDHLRRRSSWTLSSGGEAGQTELIPLRHPKDEQGRCSW